MRPDASRTPLVRFARATSAALLAVLVGGAVVAQTPTATPTGTTGAGRASSQLPRNEGVEWRSLAPAHRQALAPLEREWPSFEVGQKQKWIELAQRLPGMPVAERQRIQARMAEWARMTPAERGQARLRYLQAKRAAGADDRSAQWEAYQSLSTDEKKQLAARAQVAPTAASAAAARKSVAAVPAADPARTTPKSNLVTNPNFVAAPRTVAPTTIQARPGATTTLVSKQPSPPVHQQTGLPKIAASPGLVNQTTLLPQVGPQGAAVPLRSDDDPDDDEPAPRP